MFNPNQGIYGQKWLDIIFEGRNKQYGAFILRRDGGNYTSLALLYTSSVFIISLAAPLLKQRFFPGQEISSTIQLVDEHAVELLPPPPVDKSTPPPQAFQPPTPRTSQVRMPPPVVVKAHLVTEEPPTVDILKLVDPGSKTIEGDPDAHIHINVVAGLGDTHAQMTETSTGSELPFIHVEINPEFPGGMEGFRQYVQRHYNYPAKAIEHGVKGQVVLQFVEEIDGSLTDIKIMHDLKFGTGEEAIRLLQSSPRWKPGIQNGRAVRVAYTLPIGLDLSQ